MAEVMNGPNILNWYYDIPVVSRTYLSLALVTTFACYLDIFSPLSLYYNYDLILWKGQYWRIFSSFFFFGQISIDLLFHLYFVVRYCCLLEEGKFRARTADFVFMLTYGMIMTIILATYVPYFQRIKFLGHPFTFMMVYLWSRDPDNQHIHMSFFGVLTFSAPYLPWVLLLFSLAVGNPIESDLLGVVVGHIYFFLDYIYPQLAEIRGWPIQKVMITPPLLHYILTPEYQLNFFNTRVLEEAPRPENLAVVLDPGNINENNDPPAVH